MLRRKKDNRIPQPKYCSMHLANCETCKDIFGILPCQKELAKNYKY